MVVYDDLTLEGALADPMIDLVRRADGIDLRTFATLLRSVARGAVSASARSYQSGDHQAAIAIAARKTCCGPAHVW